MQTPPRTSWLTSWLNLVLITTCLVTCQMFHGNDAQHTPDANSIHEPDPVRLQQIATLHNQLKTLTRLVIPDSEASTMITHLCQELETIKAGYTRTSPAMVILGPIGAAAIVFKERQLDQQLRTVALSVTLLIATVVSKTITCDLTKPSLAKLPLEELILYNNTMLGTRT